MIGKISKGSNFHGLLAYLLKHGRGDILDSINLSSTDPSEVAGEMAVASMMSQRVRKPVLHCSISYGPDEVPSDAEMRSDARAALKSLGLDGNQAITIRHRDRDYIHFHIAANRVGPDGRAVHDSHSYARLETALRDIELRRGWRAVPGRNAADPDGRRFQGAALRPDPRQVSVPIPVRTALLEAKTWSELNHRLETAGWRLEVKKRPGQVAGALLVGPRGERIAAGKIDRAATFSRLQSRFSQKATPLLGSKTKQSRRGHSSAAFMLTALAGSLLTSTMVMSDLGRRRTPVLAATALRKRRHPLRRALQSHGPLGPRF
jgi:hypothetical protein